jgi:hypothetical protein
MTDPDRSFDENVYDLNAILHPGSVSIIPGMSWPTPRCRGQKKGRFWHPGHPMRQR